MKPTKTIRGEYYNYFIFEKKLFDGRTQYWVEYKTHHWFNLLKERISDWYGNTSIHPQFLNNRYHNSVESAMESIYVHRRLETSFKHSKKR